MYDHIVERNNLKGINMMSQVSAINEVEPQTWDDYERGCLFTFGGGYQEHEELEIFRHGMQTVFNLLRAEFPPAEFCKLAPELLVVCKLAQSAMGAHGPCINNSCKDCTNTWNKLKSIIKKATTTNKKI